MFEQTNQNVSSVQFALLKPEIQPPWAANLKNLITNCRFSQRRLTLQRILFPVPHLILVLKKLQGVLLLSLRLYIFVL